MASRREFARLFGAVCIALVPLGLGACGLTDQTPDYRYRLTVEIDTPEGLRTGSSVIEVQTAVSKGIPSPGTIQWRARGEAAAVDLPGGKTLFALLRSENDNDWAKRVMFMLAPEAPSGAPDSFQARFDTMLKLNGPIVLPRVWPPVGHLEERSAYPILVTFGDLDDPTSVERVDPDDLSATFGEGVALRRITVELTEESVTRGVVARLPKPDEKGFFNWDGRSNPNGGFVVGIWDFSKGKQK